MTVLTARTLITAVGTIEYPAITIDPDGLIADISTDVSTSATGTLTSGFLDVHFHGAVNEDVMLATPSGLSHIQRFLASRGVAQYLPTTVTAPIDLTLASLERLASLIESPTPHDEATPIGIHLEGPFLSHARRGVHPPDLLQRPSIKLFDRFQQAARGHIRLLTIAPEAPAAVDLIAHATQQGVRVSVGHTNATAAETLSGIAAGAVSATHTFNAMRGLEGREPGVLGTVLDREDLFAELICDGVHVSPAMVRLWLRLKRERAILVTDAMSATGMPDGLYRLAGLEVRVEGDRCSLVSAPETLAGSVLTLDRAVENLRAFTGASLAEATGCASHNPAALLGLDANFIRSGSPASFNLYNEAGKREATYLHGKKIAN